MCVWLACRVIISPMSALERDIEDLLLGYRKDPR
jgi:hypothetical protein